MTSARMSSPARYRWSRWRRASGSGWTGEKQGSLSQTRADRDRAALGHARLHGRIDRVNWDAAALELSRGRLQEREALRGAIRRAAGRADAAAAAVRAGGGEAARDRPGRRRGRVRLPDAQGRVPGRRLDAGGSRRPAREVHRRCSTRSSPPPGSGDFIIAPSEGACDYCPFNGICPGRARRLRRAQGDRRAARPAGDRRSGASHDRRAERSGRARADRRRARVKPRRRGRRGHRARPPCSSSASPTCSRRARRPWTSWS